MATCHLDEAPGYIRYDALYRTVRRAVSSRTESTAFKDGGVEGVLPSPYIANPPDMKS